MSGNEVVSVLFGYLRVPLKDTPLNPPEGGKCQKMRSFPPFGGIKGGARGGGVDLIMRKKYRENFVEYGKNIARISSNMTKISREFYLI